MTDEAITKLTDKAITKLTDEATALMRKEQIDIDGCDHPMTVPSHSDYEKDRPAREAFTRHVLAARDAEVEALKARIALLDWVPVSERMPTESDTSPDGYLWWTDGEFIRCAELDFPDKRGTATHWRRYSLPEKSDPVREAFEAWRSEQSFSHAVLVRYADSGDYQLPTVQDEWRVWKAAQNALKSA